LDALSEEPEQEWFGKRNNPVAGPVSRGPDPRRKDIPAAPARPDRRRRRPSARAQRRTGGELDSRLPKSSERLHDLLATRRSGEFASDTNPCATRSVEIAAKSQYANLTLSAASQQMVITEICNDVLGLVPEPLLARDDIARHMVNGPTGLHRDQPEDRADRHQVPRQPAVMNILPAASSRRSAARR